MGLAPTQFFYGSDGKVFDYTEFQGYPFSGFHGGRGDELHEQFESFFEDVSSLVKSYPIVYFGKLLEMIESCIYIYIYVLLVASVCCF